MALLLFDIFDSPTIFSPSTRVAFILTLSKDTGRTLPFIAKTSLAFNIALSKPPEIDVNAVKNKFPKE